ncbi:MAG TPA: hypothetical protein VEA77_05605, partial [Hyphomicrobium sp.]|nr:hypothetical protein [Hyphomicrobium sp.]
MSSQLQPQTDLDFRPASYWDLSDPVTVVLSAIAGQHRRSLARSVLTGLAAGELPDPGYLPEELFAERLDDHRRASFTAIRAALTFGEYLPALAEGSVEIARLAFTLKDEGNVLSIRAFRDVGRFIRYCVVDEHETQFTLNAPRSKRPLTLEELASLVESIRPTSSAIAAAWNERADEFKDMRM